MNANDTIFALASARGRSGVAVIRISGPKSDAALSALIGADDTPPLRSMALRTLRDAHQQILDTALVVRFAEKASFTGEFCVELHCHGGPAVVAAVLANLQTLPGLREASPGEFTRRAFDNGRLDLSQVESLADLINSETETQRRAALRHSDGSLGRMCRDWSDRLVRAAALLEATIDFADEDIPDETYALALSSVSEVRIEIAKLLASSLPSERFRDGWRVALIGAPNAGKSSLINALAMRDVAITSPTAGTTRDAIEVSLDLGGYPVTLIDTAGLRATDDILESAGIERTRRTIHTADLRIALAAADAPVSDQIEENLSDGDLRVWNKTDVSAPPDGFDLAISAEAGFGLEGLVRGISSRLAFTDPSDADALLRRRQRNALSEAEGLLTSLADGGETRIEEQPEIAAEHLRLARAALGKITGDSGVERLLDVIFSEFCLGK